jgi:type IV pilus assembly protein PilB
MKKLGEILLEKKILSKEELDNLLAKQKITKERLGDLVVKSGYLSTEQLLNIVAEQYGLQYLNIKELVIPVSLQKEVNFEVLKKYRIVPLKEDNKKLYIGINDTLLLKDIDEIAFNIGKPIVPVLISETSVERMLEDLEKLPYGSKDYVFKSLEVMIQGGKDFDALVTTILNYDSKIDRIFIKENSPPFIKKFNIIEKVPYEAFNKNHILSIIRETCDENERKLLVTNGFVSIKRIINGRRFTINFYKEKSSFFILVINSYSFFIDISKYFLGKEIFKHIFEPSKGIVFFIAPFGHGKTSLMSTIVEYFNSTRNYNILLLVDRINDVLRNNRSNIIQMEKSMTKDLNRFSELLNDFDSNILFFDNLESSNILNFIYKFVESGRPAYVSLEANSIPSAIESLLYKESESSYRYHLNRLADNVNLFVNFRLLPGRNLVDRHFVYEYCLNSFKMKKVIRDNSFNVVHTQIRGTGDYQPFEIQIAELFTKNLITYEIAENYSLDIELFKRYAKISG